MTNKAIEANDGKPLPLYQKALCGLTAGAIGASVGSPADLALIRMQADATLPVAQRRNYTNAFHALYRIVADEGVLALWKGAGPTVVRAMALNMGMLASYDQSVEVFRDSLGFGEAATVIGNLMVNWIFLFIISFYFIHIYIFLFLQNFIFCTGNIICLQSLDIALSCAISKKYQVFSAFGIITIWMDRLDLHSLFVIWNDMFVKLKKVRVKGK